MAKIPANGSRAPLTLSPRAARHARRTIAHFHADIVHFHEPFAPMVGWGALRAHTAPAVATFHRGGGGPALSLTKPLLRWLARDLDSSAAVSASAASTIKDACGIEATVLFNGFEMERFVATPRERGEETVLVVVGRNEERRELRTRSTPFAPTTSKMRIRGASSCFGDGPQRPG